MALLDRFRTQPAYKHPDPAVRLAAVGEIPLDDLETIGAVAREDLDARVRSAAVDKLMDPQALALVAREDVDAGVRARAVEMLKDIALGVFEGLGEGESLASIELLVDPRALAHVARTATREDVARRALERVSEAGTLGSIARHAALEAVRRAALDMLQDHDEIVAVAISGEFKDTSLGAIDRLSDRADLEAIASRAKNKNAARRARGLLREMDERLIRAAQETPLPSPDPAEIARAERTRIVLRLEAVMVDDSGAAEQAMRQAEDAWASITIEPEQALAARFASATARVRARVDEIRRRQAARDRVEAEVRRARDEQQAAERARREAQAGKEVERRRSRLAELEEEIVAASADVDLASARRRLTVARREWGGLSAGMVLDPAIVRRVADAEAQCAAREADGQAEDARARSSARQHLLDLLGRVEPLAANPAAPLKAVERALRDVRAGLGAVPRLLSKIDYDDIARRLKAVAAVLTPRVHELREAEKWRRFAQLAVQEQLVLRMEALHALDDPAAIARQVRELQLQWRQAADGAHPQGEPLWRRFKAAHDAVWVRCEAHFAAEAETRRANLARKIAACERAEVLADSTAWIQTADAIKQLQAEWKTIGPVTQGQEKLVWARFRSACDRFFTRRHEDLARRKALWAENLARKEALSARAEALADSTDWDPAAAEIKRLQVEWKTIGPVKKSRSDAIWQRFRGACDRFFARYARRHEAARAARVDAREALCAELEALAPAGDTADPPADLMARVRALRARWQQELAAYGLDREHAVALDTRFAAAFDGVVSGWPAVFGGSDLDPAANRTRMEALCRRVEDLLASLVGATAESDHSLSPTTRLAAMLKDALASNTIGGKVDEDTRWRAAAEDVRQAQANWMRLGPVRDEARRALSDRFERACRRITDRKPSSLTRS